MVDTLDLSERSIRMSLVRSKGNRSTEALVEQALIANDFSGWENHPPKIIGKPDFMFPQYKLLIFVDGCFWHSCPKCKRHIPENNRQFWIEKIEGNRKRDNRTRRYLRKQGFHVMRIWEHEIRKGKWIHRLQLLINRIDHYQRMIS